MNGAELSGLKSYERVAKGLAYVPQGRMIFSTMTVKENIETGLVVSGESEVPRDIYELFPVLLEMKGRRGGNLSGGQQQQLAIARALATKPKVLLLDEPLSNLDAKLREEMQFELRGIQQRVGTTTIMVTHDQSEALSMSDRVVVMERGRIMQVDAPYRLYESPATPFISSFVGKMNRLSGVWRHGGVEIGGRVLPCEGADLADGAAAVLEIRPEKISLRPRGAGVLDGQIKARFFLGGSWYFTVETPAGLIGVSLPNAGEEPAREADQVGLDWSNAGARASKPDGAQPA